MKASAGRATLYVVLGVVAVVGVALMWGRMDRTAAEPPPGAVTTAAPVVPAEDGLVVPAGTDVLAADGTRYWSPAASFGSSEVVTVDLTVTLPEDATGEVEVPWPTPRAVVGGVGHEAYRTNPGPRTARPGATVGSSAAFDVPPVEPRELIDVVLVLDDGMSVTWTGVVLRY